jgi:RimJ/RimL family protein N-acetyltransferase
MRDVRLETERLILRNIDADRDFDSWARTMSDERTVKYIGGKVLDRALAWRSMAAVVGHWEIRGYGFFSVEHKQTRECIGRVGPWNPEGWPAPEIGWTLMRDHWGKGYATEAARAALEYAFNVLNWANVIHVILKGNESSIAVAERIGSTFIRQQQGLPGVTDDDVLIYGQSRR